MHHRAGASAPRGGEKKGLKIKRSAARGGLSTKIHMAVRGLGWPVRFTLTAGQKGDAPQAAALIEGWPAEAVMADTAYDADLLRQAIDAKGAIAVIPNNPSRALKYPLDKHLCALVGAYGDAFELLELAEEVLDQMPPFVHLVVDGERLCAARMLRNDDLGSQASSSAMMALLSNAVSAIRASKANPSMSGGTLHFRPFGVRQNKSIHPKLKSRLGQYGNPESQQALGRVDEFSTDDVFGIPAVNQA